MPRMPAPNRVSCWRRFRAADASLIDERAEAEMQAVIDLISRVRNIRAEMNIKPSDRIQLMIAAKSDLKTVFSDSTDQIARLTRAKEISIDGSSEMPKAAARAVLAGGAEVAVPLEGLIDFEQERARLGSRERKAGEGIFETGSATWQR